MKNQTGSRLLRFLVLLLVITTGMSLLLAMGWYRSIHRSRAIDSLSPEERYELVKKMLEVSPGMFSATLYDRAVSYTLKRNQKLTIWGSTFRTNELGYRTGTYIKRPKTFRIVFLGDSWTYGLGVEEKETFAKVLERLANQRSGFPRRIESWCLALPGYNIFNEIAALDCFFDVLQPDAVVLCPTINDIDTSKSVLPNGSLGYCLRGNDNFGDPFPFFTRSLVADSFKIRTRWRRCFSEVRNLEKRLQTLKIPFLIFFTATWNEPFAHVLIREAGIEAPYVITPEKFATHKYRNPPPLFHPTPKAHTLYAKMIYKGLTGLIQWKPFPIADPDVDVAVHRADPSVDWEEECRSWIREKTRKLIPTSYTPSSEPTKQCTGTMDPKTGLMDKGTSLLLRRKEGAERLVIVVQRLKDKRFIYPLQLTVTIPTSCDQACRKETIPPVGTDLHRFVVKIPNTVAPEQAMDVVFEAERVAVDVPDMFSGSVYIKEIIQE